MDRRHFLGALGLSAGGLAGASTRIHVRPFESWEPTPGTWPLPRYDLHNAAANPHASPPSEPSVAWRTSPLDRVERIVVGPRRVYAGGTVSSFQAVAALDRDSGEVAWSVSVLNEALAFRNGTLYVAGRERVTALDAETGETTWSAVSRATGEMTLLATDGTVVVGDRYDWLAAFDAETGTRHWSTGDGGPGAIAGGALVATGRVRRFAPRRLSDVVTSSPPPVAWQSDVYGDGSPVAVDGRVVLGNPNYSGEFGLRSLDFESGTLQWATVDALKESDPDGDDAVGTPAVADGRAFVDLDLGGQGRSAFRALIACSLSDGSVAWRRPFESELLEVVVAGDVVLAGTGTFRRAEESTGEIRAVAGGVRAFGLGGDERWRVETDSAIASIAAVEDTVFVASGAYRSEHPGGVSALR